VIGGGHSTFPPKFDPSCQSTIEDKSFVMTCTLMGLMVSRNSSEPNSEAISCRKANLTEQKRKKQKGLLSNGINSWQILMRE
jgi:hypothetical protein